MVCQRGDDTIKQSDRYLLYHPVDGVVYISIAVNLVCHRDLAHMFDFRVVPLCSYESVASLQDPGRPILLPEGTKNGTTRHSGRPRFSAGER
jgi:hypothetical protein